MSNLIRSMLIVGVAGLLVVACGEKAAEPVAAPAPAPAVAAPAPPAPAANVAPAAGGGYEPTAEERVPGITLDPATVTEAPAADASPAPEMPAAAPEAKK